MQWDSGVRIAASLRLAKGGSKIPRAAFCPESSILHFLGDALSSIAIKGLEIPIEIRGGF
ncbi:MAG: hypothetical protein JRJ29_09035 [Deltaproteobacteria bacterium]|nr:hypothetical protein [Deltaproteobacteria bacterium]